MQELNGKTAVITGASRGIGAATARELANCGVSVILAARTLVDTNAIAEEINQAGGKAIAVQCDVSNYDEVAAAISKCIEEFGHIDILINNAGVIDPIARIADSDPQKWSQVVDINVKGVYYGLRAAIPAMESQGSGVIINLSSGAANGALEGWSHYCATKAAVLSLTRCTDKECRENGIRVIGLSPGTVATDMQIKIKASGINPVSQLDPSAHISAEWSARAIAWLCTEAASEFCGTDFSLKDEENRKKAGLI